MGIILWPLFNLTLLSKLVTLNLYNWSYHSCVGKKCIFLGCRNSNKFEGVNLSHVLWVSWEYGFIVVVWGASGHHFCRPCVAAWLQQHASMLPNLPLFLPTHPGLKPSQNQHLWHDFWNFVDSIFDFDPQVPPSFHLEVQPDTACVVSTMLPGTITSPGYQPAPVESMIFPTTPWMVQRCYIVSWRVSGYPLWNQAVLHPSTSTFSCYHHCHRCNPLAGAWSATSSQKFFRGSLRKRYVEAFVFFFSGMNIVYLDLLSRILWSKTIGSLKKKIYIYI